MRTLTRYTHATERLLRSGRRIPVHIQLDDDSVEDFRTPADKEHHVFFSGRFQRLAHPHPCSGGGLDLHQTHADLRHLAVRVIADGGECPRCGCAQVRIAVLHPADADAGEEVAAILHGIEHRGGQPGTIVEQHQEALDHWSPVGRLVVSEGSRTARSIAASLPVAA